MVQEITLFSGIVVRVRPVPPLLSRQVIANRADLRRPRPPLVEVKGVAGTELVAARAGEPEYELWVQRLDEIEVETRRIQDNFMWNWGVVDWREPGSEKFVKDPPKSWQVPELLTQFGLVPSKTDALTRRLLYIQSELIVTNDDFTLVGAVMFVESALVKEEEVEVASDSFPSETEGEPTT